MTTLQNTPTTTAAPALQRYDAFLASIPASSTTGWRWRKEGMIRTTNIAGRCYVSAAAIQSFLTRAEAGEFAKEHKTPAVQQTRAA